jgi:crotonobetainyl-CoA:carnitine CoA-transferase CaiB-like acyl-CoA transferase
VTGRGRHIEHDHPALGKTELPGVPLRLAEGPLALERAPFLGEHNREIARGLGYADPDIAALERDGVLHSDPAVPTER